MRPLGFTRVPRLLRYLALHAIFGAGIGICAAASLLYLDVAGLGTLFAASDMKIEAGVLLFAFFALTFASLSMGSAIMLLPRDDSFPRDNGV
jgi:hypothetical protein